MLTLMVTLMFLMWLLLFKLSGGRGQEATSASFTKNDEGMVMSSNGVVGAVQITISW